LDDPPDEQLARYLINADRWFEIGHFINANGPLRQETPTLLTAMVFVRDGALGAIDTPHGAVEFLQIVGLTSRQ
jgi:suppressor of fused-like protein